MKADVFLERLEGLFEDFPRSEHPRDRRFAPIAKSVENLACENNLALLNAAASCLEGDKAYVEIGVFHGASLIAAMLGNEDKRFVGVDSFSGRNVSHITASSSVRVVPRDFSTRPGCGPCGRPDGCSVIAPMSTPLRDEKFPST